MPKQVKKSAITTVNVSIRPDQRKMLEEYASKWGYISTSQTMRVILDEWKRDREQEQAALNKA